MIEVLDDELSFEDDYSSALHRMRRLMKKKKKGGKKSNVNSPRPSVNSPRSTEEVTVDIGECNETTAPGPSTPNRETTMGEGLGIVDVAGEDVKEEEEEEEEDEASSGHQRRNSQSVDEYAERMRTAAIMLAQLQQNAHTVSATSNTTATFKNTEEIRQRIIKEMMALEEQRMSKMKNEGVDGGVAGNGGGEAAGGEIIEDEQLVTWVVNKDDPSGKALI